MQKVVSTKMCWILGQPQTGNKFCTLSPQYNVFIGMIYSSIYELLESALLPSTNSTANLTNETLKTLLEVSDSNTVDSKSSTSNVRSLLQYTIPDGKLMYPEPFIASPSYLHSDLTYLHIFQYWYWLWFMFIFLICFFFISFLCTVRWCTNRVRPRRETRGVSRSKCGDLITACVPVSWAISIIVHESTDATDLNDGFGTAELVVGVRAYQWGWEYYYPRSIDLNYSVRPSYSTFVGNSLKYNFSSGKNLSSNSLWRMYQNKSEDRVITPAHLLLIPSDSGNSVSFLNFNNLGLNTLRESSAFSKIRNSTKIYNSHLVHTPSYFTGKYSKLNTLYSDENSYLTTSSFGLKKQHSLYTASAAGSSPALNMLDINSFNQFLDSNIGVSAGVTSEALRLGPSPLSLSKASSLDYSADSTRLASILPSTNQPYTSSNITTLSRYPSLIENINDDSDKSGLAYPAGKLVAPNSVSASFTNKELVYSQSTLAETSSTTVNMGNILVENNSTTSKLFNRNGPNSKVLLGDQSIRSLPKLTPTKSNLNLSSGVNTVVSNLHFSDRSNRPTTPFTNGTASSVNQIDYTLFNRISSARSFLPTSHPAVLSSSVNESNSLGYDSTASVTRKVTSSTSNVIEETSFKNVAVGEAFVGSREKTPRSMNTAYWSTFWSASDHSQRIRSSLNGHLSKSAFYLPVFSTYSDYDFRNDQAIDILEELFWENSYSSFNFYDYVSIAKDTVTPARVSLKDAGLGKYFYSSTLGSETSSENLVTPAMKDLSLVGDFYASSVQLEDYIQKPTLINASSFALLPIYSELNDTDDVFTNFKYFSPFFNKFSTSLVLASGQRLSARSYISVFNSFRSDFVDFSWQRSDSSKQLTTLPSPLTSLDPSDVYSASLINNSYAYSDGSAVGSDLRLSNPATLRSSVRNSIINYNAFQKVFKPRLDEGRAHVQSSSFADLGLKQPFISDSKVPYLQLLGKNRDSFFETPLYFTTTHKSLNTASSLMDALNTPMYDFPFLLAKTSDTMRFTWIDWFSKWKHIEVQPSSVSRYSTLGVPYLRKPFDFNSNTGDKFQDTELYFTRVARSRRNYLTNWSYSPFMYNRAYVWNAASDLDAALMSTESSIDYAKLACSSAVWYLSAPAFDNSVSDFVTFSSSGNNVYGKSTWRPRSSIESYYYNVSKLVDILSRREHLYRQYLENSRSIVYLPRALCATPNNPLLVELKSSFCFSDPSNYSSEFSRDLFYSSTPYFKFVYIKQLVNTAGDALSKFPINIDLMTNYVFLYFFGADSQDIGRNAELYKSQFRPLKKGISSMLRLHATGAVAMPIETRLQVLASSRDVIHSWSIPSASIKIDCVPGYTSHRMMKFLLTGVYWGQCQEICGRYHHWMPIVVYFMKRDLFFLWCTHFVFTPSQNETWDISDRRFSDFIRFASYDKSSWLNEFGYSTI